MTAQTTISCNLPASAEVTRFAAFIALTDAKAAPFKVIFTLENDTAIYTTCENSVLARAIPVENDPADICFAESTLLDMTFPTMLIMLLANALCTLG